MIFKIIALIHILYKVSQTFSLTGRITLSDNDEQTNLGEYRSLLKPLRDLILNGGNLEKVMNFQFVIKRVNIQSDQV